MLSRHSSTNWTSSTGIAASSTSTSPPTTRPSFPSLASPHGVQAPAPTRSTPLSSSLARGGNCEDYAFYEGLACAHRGPLG